MEIELIKYVKEGFLAALIVYLLWRERADRDRMVDLYNGLKDAINALREELKRRA